MSSYVRNGIVNIRVNKYTRDVAESVLEFYGLTISDLINILLARTVVLNTIPFSQNLEGENHILDKFHESCGRKDINIRDKDGIINVRVHKETRDKAEEIFVKNGLTLSAVINLLLIETIRRYGIPFDLNPDSAVNLVKSLCSAVNKTFPPPESSVQTIVLGLGQGPKITIEKL